MRSFRFLVNLLTLYFRSVSRKYFYKNHFDFPEVINLNANDICDSGCVMCNIWKRKIEHELSPDELEKILRDQLFEHVKYVGITGGEPTLRKDLPRLFEAVIKARPDIQGLSIITNGIKFEQVKERVLASFEVCKSYQVPFSVMVSLDGVGAVHDNIRGKSGNFESAVRLIEYLRHETEIPVSIGCTISKGNVWDVDELLDYLKSKNIYGRFRIAEFINRLYNDENADVIRNFDEDERYHLQLFLKKLEHSYETNQDVKRTYLSIIHMLGGGKRLIGCPYQTSGVVVNSRGELAYCAPKSGIIGNAMEITPSQAYVENLDKRAAIINDHCDDCIHDYHAPITLDEFIVQSRNKFWSWVITRYDNKKALFLSLIPRKIGLSKSHYNVLIVGWYGTETVGDKAILQGIIEAYKAQYSSVKIYVASIYPFITKRTLYELGQEESCHVVHAMSADLIYYSKYCDETVIGGGPLMEINELAIPYIGFSVARKYKKKRVVFGCGLGPLKNEWSKRLVRILLTMATEIRLRDHGSKQLALSLNPNVIVAVTDDPAKKTIKDLRIKEKEASSDKISCFLRDWTEEYAMADIDFFETKERFERGLANYIKQKATETGVRNIHFYHMHNFVIGHDDREFSRRFVKKYFASDNFNVTIQAKLSTIENISEAMLRSRLNICMRFHSVLFAHTLDANFVAIDYTMGGKIRYYLEENDCLDRLLTLSEVCIYENYPSNNID